MSETKPFCTRQRAKLQRYATPTRLTNPTACRNGARAAAKAKKVKTKRYDTSNFQTYMKKLDALVEKIRKFRVGLAKVVPHRPSNDAARP